MQFLKLLALSTKKVGSWHLTGSFGLAEGHSLTQTEYLKASRGSLERLEMSGATKYK